MANNINHVVLTGNLTADPELRSTGGGTSVCKMRLAVNRRAKDPSSGEWSEVPSYFNVIAWEAQGENCAKYLTKGSPIAVQGELTWREFEHEGKKRESIEVKAFKVQFLSSGDPQQTSAGSAPAPAPDDDDIPF